MLFRRDVLDAIAAGTVTLAFRRWKRAAVRPGTRIRTAVGLVEIVDIAATAPARITAVDARAAGHRDREALLRALDRRGGDGTVYRIVLRHAGADPRVALREEAAPGPEALTAAAQALAAIDARSRRGPWTRQALRLIADNPGTRAADLAARLGRETKAFKADIRRLKELGLTESLDTGYRLSPRGRAVLAHPG